MAGDIFCQILVCVLMRKKDGIQETRKYFVAQPESELWLSGRFQPMRSVAHFFGEATFCLISTLSGSACQAECLCEIIKGLLTRRNSLFNMMADRRRINGPSGSTTPPVYSAYVTKGSDIESKRPSRTRGPASLRPMCMFALSK